MQIPYRKLTRTARAEGGQVFVLVAVSMVAICAMAGFAIDAATWYQGHRKQQAIADAAVLAAVESLPSNTGQAAADAQSYTTKNNGVNPTITFSSKNMTNDTVTVSVSATKPSYFLKAIGIGSTTVTARSTATAENLQNPYGAMPFGIFNTQPQISGPGCPCFNQTTTLTVGRTGAGNFGLVNVDGSSGPANPSTIAGWIQNGCSCSTPAPATYGGSPGARFNASAVQSAMPSTINRVSLFPVYDSTAGNGSNFTYHVIGWSAFVVTSYALRGSSGTITGYFVKANWRGVGTSNTATYYGVTTARLSA